jgi:CBS domain-containing protein
MQFLARSSPWRDLFQDPRQLEGVTAGIVRPLVEALHSFPLGLQDDAVKAWQLQLVKALQRLDLPAWRISQLISDHNAWLYREALEESLAEMHTHGWGSPPVGFCVLLLGSGARSESLLRPDQDNAMILEDYPLERHQEIDTWFQHLGERFTEKLDQVGIPLCQGHVMARWPLWRKPLKEWIDQMRIWTSGRVVKRVQLSNILLDFTSVYGDSNLEKAFRKELQQLLPKANGFLHEMGELLDEIPVALDGFERLAGDQEDAPHSHALNLKRQGLLPLQSTVRLLCLIKGVFEGVSTRDRLTSLVTQQVLSPQEAADLAAALQNLQALLLAAQLKSLDAGRKADNWVDSRELTAREKSLLKLDLKLIRNLVRRTRKQLPSL